MNRNLFSFLLIITALVFAACSDDTDEPEDLCEGKTNCVIIHTTYTGTLGGVLYHSGFISTDMSAMPTGGISTGITDPVSGEEYTVVFEATANQIYLVAFLHVGYDIPSGYLPGEPLKIYDGINYEDYPINDVAGATLLTIPEGGMEITLNISDDDAIPSID